jgi:hypothetical protein
MVLFGLMLLVVIAGQVFWLHRVRKWATGLISNPAWRKRLGWMALAGYLILLAEGFGGSGHGASPTHLTLKAALLEAPFKWWFFGSTVGFLFVVLFFAVARVFRLVAWAYHRVIPSLKLTGIPSDPLGSPSRRRFLERTALAVGALPFAAGAYGLIYERLDLQTTRQRIHLRRLPKAFDGFRIAQLSDIHIGPFMTEADIRRIVATTNQLKADLIVLTGDYVTWDPSNQGAVVKALAGLKAPHGVFGCLGNHELWTRTEDSITRLFAAAGIPILRQARLPIMVGGGVGAENLNLIGVDFQTRFTLGFRAKGKGLVREYLFGVDRLLQPDTVNILLSHNPNSFDRAAELGIDLSLAGHTHGGQVSIEFVHRGISPGRLISPYIRGWFQKGDAQLYVNRGIGTIGIPIRIDAPPELTVFELVRG